MNIQSLSIDVPAGCPNNCFFCVSKQHRNNYDNLIEKAGPIYQTFYKNEYIKRLIAVKDTGCDNVILTGNGEVMLNQEFIGEFGAINSSLPSSFKKIELQTSGYGLDRSSLSWLRNTIEINTISLSLNSFDDTKNWEIQGSPKHCFSIEMLCKTIKEFNFTLRLSLNMSDAFEEVLFDDIIKRCKELQADQVTFRKMYAEGNSKEADWVKNHCVNIKANHMDFIMYENRLNTDLMKVIKRRVSDYRALNKLSFGATKYDVEGIAIVIDDDCMNTQITSDFKYMILRPDCRLYSHWDTKSSLWF